LGQSIRETCLLLIRQPILRGHEHYSGSFMELGKNPGDENFQDCGLSRSSEEVSERRSLHEHKINKIKQVSKWKRSEGLRLFSFNKTTT